SIRLHFYAPFTSLLPLFFHAPATTETYTLSLHDALPILGAMGQPLKAALAIDWKAALDPLAHTVPSSEEELLCAFNQRCQVAIEIGRAHVLTPVTDQSRMPSSA